MTKNKSILNFLFFVAISATLIQSLDIQQLERKNRVIEECQRESKVTQEMIIALRHGHGETVIAPQFRKQALCVAKKTKIMDENDLVDVNMVRTKLRNINMENEKIEQIISQCCSNMLTPEETALNTFRCLYKNEPNFVYI